MHLRCYCSKSACLFLACFWRTTFNISQHWSLECSLGQWCFWYIYLECTSLWSCFRQTSRLIVCTLIGPEFWLPSLIASLIEYAYMSEPPYKNQWTLRPSWASVRREISYRSIVCSYKEREFLCGSRQKMYEVYVSLLWTLDTDLFLFLFCILCCNKS